MTEEEKKKYEAFKYWLETNTEKGVTTLPDSLCKSVIKLIEKQSKEIERQKEINKEHQELNGRLRQYIKELEEKVEKYKSTWD